MTYKLATGQDHGHGEHASNGSAHGHGHVDEHGHVTKKQKSTGPVQFEKNDSCGWVVVFILIQHCMTAEKKRMMGSNDFSDLFLQGCNTSAIGSVNLWGCRC